MIVNCQLKYVSMKNQYIISTFILFAWLLSACHHDTSPAPLKFTAYENNPILGPGEPGEWDELVVLIPSALRHENVFYLFFSGWHPLGF